MRKVCLACCVHSFLFILSEESVHSYLVDSSNFVLQKGATWLSRGCTFVTAESAARSTAKASWAVSFVRNSLSPTRFSSVALAGALLSGPFDSPLAAFRTRFARFLDISYAVIVQYAILS